ncbi:YkgJ family cysteine cluster protein [Halocalculus aciditolerans]|uniref:YkgJ family cysteine cluster protein n=1 Tax=Halocalculus aciditolerans TaxID=1383812 RepID=A0A830F1P4_9EURY|nr:YkgJ family cysteine cluster protein [Halocalculus aciditolerans]GGL46462.1 hypothetical protein GCM10009039_01020 [Halocalculus aciditolerans]
MDVNCEGCAGCCVDWRPLVDAPGHDHERRGPRQPLDDTYNLVPLTRADVRAFVDAGLADALTPRVWRAEADDDSVEIDGYDLAAIGDRPVFFVGIRKPPKPVAPFDADAHWLPACAFLDPDTLQCRIHGSERYPAECADYPGHNLVLDVETECERVEAAWGGERLRDDTPPDDLPGFLLGPAAVGEKVFAYPDPDDLDGVVGRIAAGDPTKRDRARFVAAACGHAPGTLATNDAKREQAFETAMAADSWVGRAIDEWTERADTDTPDPGLGERVEDARGAPSTPGWS